MTGGTCAKVTHFGVKGANVHRVQIWSKHAKVAVAADTRLTPANQLMHEHGDLERVFLRACEHGDLERVPGKY